MRLVFISEKRLKQRTVSARALRLKCAYHSSPASTRVARVEEAKERITADKVREGVGQGHLIHLVNGKNFLSL